MIDLQKDPLSLESIYEEALCIELNHQGLKFERQLLIPMKYRDRLIGDVRPDLLIEKSAVLELKCVGKLDPIFEAQLLTYMRISGMKKGLLINFNSRLLKDGIKRLVF
jgi:GxxExxY protein